MKREMIDISDNIVGLLSCVNARPTVYCGLYSTEYLKRWVDYLNNNTLPSKWGTKDVRIYAQYGEKSNSFAMFGIPTHKNDTMFPAISGMRENPSTNTWRKEWFK
jgi:hypothetical protein